MDLNADTPALDPERYDALSRSAERFGRSLTTALSGGIAQGRSFDRILQSVGTRFVEIGLSAAMKPLEAVLSSGIRSMLSGLSGAGGASVPVQAFADGGVINAPTWFPMGRGSGGSAGGGLGLAGEAGAEAIMPLARGADGKLGVRSAAPARAANVTVNITTSDAESFRRSQTQVSAAIARAVARGQRGL